MGLFILLLFCHNYSKRAIDYKFKKTFYCKSLQRIELANQFFLGTDEDKTKISFMHLNLGFPVPCSLLPIPFQRIWIHS